MAGYDNIKDKGFDKRSTEELRAIQSKGGKNSGKVRRRNADFRKTLNSLLTAKIDSPEWEPILKELGIDTTLESAMLMSMIKKALSGNVKAAEFVAQYAGQSTATDKDDREQDARIDKIKADAEQSKAQTVKLSGEDAETEYLDDIEGDIYGDNTAKDNTL